MEVGLHFWVLIFSCTFVDLASTESFFATSRCYGSFMSMMNCKAAGIARLNLLRSTANYICMTWTPIKRKAQGSMSKGIGSLRGVNRAIRQKGLNRISCKKLCQIRNCVTCSSHRKEQKREAVQHTGSSAPR